MKTRLHTLIILIIFLYSNIGQCQNIEDKFVLCKNISVKKDANSGLYLLHSKKNKILDTLSYVKGDSLYNLKIDTLEREKDIIIVLHFCLSNISKGSNYNSRMLGKKITLINLTSQTVAYSLLTHIDYSKTIYHNYSIDNDANSEEETFFSYAFEYEIISPKSIKIISRQTTGVLSIDYHYLRDYLTYRKEGLYVLNNKKMYIK